MAPGCPSAPESHQLLVALGCPSASGCPWIPGCLLAPECPAALSYPPAPGCLSAPWSLLAPGAPGLLGPHGLLDVFWILGAHQQPLGAHGLLVPLSSCVPLGSWVSISSWLLLGNSWCPSAPGYQAGTLLGPPGFLAPSSPGTLPHATTHPGRVLPTCASRKGQDQHPALLRGGWHRGETHPIARGRGGCSRGTGDAGCCAGSLHQPRSRGRAQR